MKRRLFSLLLLILCTVCSIYAQQKASVNGYITDIRTGETLISASVGLAEINRGASTNTSGYYTITSIPPGSYTLFASFVGYDTYRKEVELEAGQSLRLNIELTPSNLQLEEIVVESETEKRNLRNIGVSSVKTQRIKELPSVIEPDVFRSVQLLPGVAAASDFSSGLYVRGGGPDQTLILLDQTTVYNPSHFFGFFSTFNPDAVKDVRLYKGGYPAEYGGRLGSVLTVFNKDGNRNETKGSASVGLLASRASIEGPYKYGSWMLAVRRSTLEPLLSVLRNSVDETPDTFYFFDINGKINIDASPNDRISVAFYSGTDVVSVPFRQDANIGLNYGNQTGSVQWRRIFSDRLFGSFTATGSRYFNSPDFEINGTPFERRNTIHDVSLKGDLEYSTSEKNTISAGAWGGSLTLKLRDSFDNQATFRSRTQTNYLAAYVQNRWEPGNRWNITGGLRSNIFSEGNYFRVEPRLSAEYRLSSEIRLQAAYGRYYQFLTLITNEAFAGFDTWLTTADGVPPSFGDQFVLGAKTTPFTGYAFDVEVYYRTMRDLFELDPFINDAAGLDYQDLFRFGRGFAYGIELFFEKQAGRLTGFAGYTFGITRRKFPGFNAPVLQDRNQARFFSPKFDRTNDMNIVLSYRLSGRWSVNSVFNYATGQAFTEPVGRTQFTEVPFGTTNRDTFIIDNVNGSRLPAYHRLDLAFSRKGTFFGMGEAEWQFQIINVYSRRNIWFFNFDFDENPVERTDVGMLPIIPSLSYTVNF